MVVSKSDVRVSKSLIEEILLPIWSAIVVSLYSGLEDFVVLMTAGTQVFEGPVAELLELLIGGSVRELGGPVDICRQ